MSIMEKNLPVAESLGSGDDAQYKKGELLFDGNITTSYVMVDDDPRQRGIETTAQINVFPEILIVNFENVDYTCEAAITDSTSYGLFNMDAFGPVLNEYPFGFSLTTDEENNLYFYTRNAGTYAVKIYIAVEDSGSDTPSDAPTYLTQVKEYLKKNSFRPNWSLLFQIFKKNNIEITPQIKTYLKTTPWNTNLNMLKSLVGSGGAGANALTNESGVELTDENGNVIEAN